MRYFYRIQSPGLRKSLQLGVCALSLPLARFLFEAFDWLDFFPDFAIFRLLPTALTSAWIGADEGWGTEKWLIAPVVAALIVPTFEISSLVVTGLTDPFFADRPAPAQLLCEMVFCATILESAMLIGVARKRLRRRNEPATPEKHADSAIEMRR